MYQSPFPNALSLKTFRTTISNSKLEKIESFYICITEKDSKHRYKNLVLGIEFTILILINCSKDDKCRMLDFLTVES